MGDDLDGLSAEKKMIVETAFARGSKLELSLGCSDVPRMDIMSNSDPFCVVYLRCDGDGWEKLGITETIVDTHTCKWIKKFLMDKSAICSELRFEVYDRDSVREKLKDHDFIGYVEGEYIMSTLESGKSTIKVSLSRQGAKGNLGMLSITLDWIENPLINYDIIFTIKLNYSVRAKLYFQIMKKIPCDSQYVPVFRSGLLAKDDTQFEAAKIKLSQLAAGSSSRTFRIELFQFYPMGRSKVLGFVRTSVDELSNAAPSTKMVWHSCNNGFDEARVLMTSKCINPSGKAFNLSILE